MWDFSNTTSMIRGRHTVSFGASYRRWKLNRDLANNFLGVAIAETLAATQSLTF